MSPSKFKFDTEFRDGGEQISLAVRARSRKMYTQEDIDQICAKARAEGMKVGEVRALEAVAQGSRDMTGALRETLARTNIEIRNVRREAAEIAFAVARRLAPMALDALPAADVEHALRDAIHQAIGEPRIVLRASARVVEALGSRIDEIAHEEGFEGRVIVAADPAIKGADCRIEWRGGGAERNEQAIEHALAELLERHFSNSPNCMGTEE
jgi:flagellar assembly protein FliH